VPYDNLATAMKILSFNRLPRGWHYGDGGPLSRARIDAALSLFWRMNLLGFDTDAFPGAHGELMVAGNSANHYIEAIAEADNSISIVYEVNDAEVLSASNISLEKADEILKNIAAEMASRDRWNTLGSYIQNISILPRTVSRVSPSVTIQMADVLYNSWNASLRADEQSVPMPEYFTIPELQVIPHFSGFSTTRLYEEAG
jgi:hypothetical protein